MPKTKDPSMFLPKDYNCQIYWSDLLVVSTVRNFFRANLPVHTYFPWVNLFYDCLFTLFAVEIFQTIKIASKFDQEKFVTIKCSGKSDQ